MPRLLLPVTFSDVNDRVLANPVSDANLNTNKQSFEPDGQSIS